MLKPFENNAVERLDTSSTFSTSANLYDKNGQVGSIGWGVTN